MGTGDRARSEERLRALPWDGLLGVAAGLDAPLAEVLAGGGACAPSSVSPTTGRSA